jgi:phospholipase/carboxylesterase
VTLETFAPPVVATHGSADPSAPRVVLPHGRGSNEREILGLGAHLPNGPQYAAVGAPIAEGSGYAWFANGGIDAATGELLRELTLDTTQRYQPTGRPPGPTR